MRNTIFAMPFLVGVWFGSGQPGDKASMWLIHQQADGTFTVLFRACTKGHNLDEVETGHWRLDGDTEILNVEMVDGSRAFRSDSYKILWHDLGKQIYRYSGSGFVYTSKRVDLNFTMPDCQTIS